LLKRTWGENVAGQAGIGAAFGLIIVGALLLGVVLTVLAAQVTWWLAVTVAVTFLLGMLLLGIYQAALSGIYSATLYRYAVTHDIPDAFRSTDLEHAFLPKGG